MPDFSYRPARIKRFQTIHRNSVDVARGHMLLFEIGTKALPIMGSEDEWNNLECELALRLLAAEAQIPRPGHVAGRGKFKPVPSFGKEA
jgi:hypothetical protein